VATNYDDVLGQLQSAGLEVDSLDVCGRLVRCRVEGDREKRGWYVLHELFGVGGDTLIVGSFGIWHGPSNNAQKIEIGKDRLSPEQQEGMRRRLKEDRQRADQARQREADRAAAAAAKAWTKCAPDGEAEYLHRKGVAAHGVRFSPSGAVVLPLLDVAGKIHGLQVIRTAAEAKAKGRPQKEFWPRGVVKKGHFHLVGIPTTILLVAEGYATAASLHAATGLPTAVAFDAGNLAPVAAALHKRYKAAKILICADDDAFTDGNPGVSLASAAAVEVGGSYVRPEFADEAGRRSKFERMGHKITDFNDLHALEGLHVVRQQIEARISELGWKTVSPARGISPPDGAGAQPKPIQTMDEMLRRYVLVYGQGGTIFDRQEHMLISVSDMRDVCARRELHRAWFEHPDREIARVANVDFDPSEQKPGVTCNLWAGWPTKPAKGSCDRLLEMLWHMCSGEKKKSNDLFRWVCRWLAYPIQHPGAKLKSCIVVHGPQGTGKNLFFEAYMSIFGQYGRMLDQSALEDKFNDWASRKLFLLADEVVARTEVYHLKNKLKSLITGDRIRINPKNLAAYEEDNHANFVFLSNESMPVVLEEDDRRHAVIWTPGKLEPAFYQALVEEIRNGGAAALHDYLLHFPIEDFHVGTPPPMTSAKSDLIGLGLDSPLRFYDELMAKEITGLSPRPSLTNDWYEAYRIWCSCEGTRAAPRPRFQHMLMRKRRVQGARKRYVQDGKTMGPHGFLMIDDIGDLAGDNENAVLGGHVADLRRELAEYRR
jgi:putative DNA primase/helicase